jgi:ribose transport system ATP-binding protein
MNALTFEGIGKSFFGVNVLKDVSLTLETGRVLGLVGQNGAGKSTLMNILGGVIAPDAGTMTLDGAAYAPGGPREAEGRGVAFIHQELNLFSNLTIAENIFIGELPRGPSGLVNRRALREKTAALLRDVELDLDPGTPVERLSPGERQLVEIAKALQLDAAVVIFDEPTTSLTPRETARLFELIGRLKAAGKTVIYISHVLKDVRTIADDIAVLRDGKLVGSGPASDFPIARMINLMLGRDIDQLYPPHQRHARDAVLLETRGLSLRGVIKDVSLTLREGEILGLFGLMGSGRTELARILFGLDHFHRGELLVRGRTATTMTPRRAIGSRMAFITENRREEGLMMNVSIAENIALAALPAFRSVLPGFVDTRAAVAAASAFATALRLKSGAIGQQAAKSLSGGNQQKVVIAKWLMADPAIFILDEPTRGIDIEAKYEIYTIIQQLAARGCGVLFISSEIEEVMAMADRILVMSQGEIVGQFARAEFDKERILRVAFRQEEKAA